MTTAPLYCIKGEVGAKHSEGINQNRPPTKPGAEKRYNIIGIENQYLTGVESRYLFTISATLNTIASSNSRRSRPVSFLIFSRR